MTDLGTSKKAPAWETMSDTEMEDLTDVALDVAIDFVRENYATNQPEIMARLEDDEITRRVRTAIWDALAAFAYVAFAFPNLDDRDGVADAKVALKKLNKIRLLLSTVPEGAISRYARNIDGKNLMFSDELRASLDEAITFFRRRSGGRLGRPFNGYYLAAENVVRAFELLTGREFKRDLKTAEHAKNDHVFLNPDALFVEQIMQTINPVVTRSNVKSALQKFLQEKNDLKKRAEISSV
ncbi:hypothetical protein HFO55_34380 [Rhizobium leguminosarum]|uniref:hypothetical protein n=1 Tax=Rhizobium leguminosarum TaxID=384 RepID=UPI001C94FE20|nr:hypothetical protein [Rhizobium leguminosarum]MBY5572187.1 hypothetical protein [Rhizobium leguminosarum]MBY5578792.1 hypothetical protein [Rhizobium leguminosarum]